MKANQTVGAGMLAFLWAIIITITFVMFGWMGAFILLGALLVCVVSVVAINLLAGLPPFDFPGIIAGRPK